MERESSFERSLLTDEETDDLMEDGAESNIIILVLAVPNWVNLNEVINNQFGDKYTQHCA